MQSTSEPIPAPSISSLSFRRASSCMLGSDPGEDPYVQPDTKPCQPSEVGLFSRRNPSLCFPGIWDLNICHSKALQIRYYIGRGKAVLLPAAMSLWDPMHALNEQTGCCPTGQLASMTNWGNTAPPETDAAIFPTCPTAKGGSTHYEHAGTVTKHLPFLSQIALIRENCWGLAHFCRSHQVVGICKRPLTITFKIQTGMICTWKTLNTWSDGIRRNCWWQTSTRILLQ